MICLTLTNRANLPFSMAIHRNNRTCKCGCGTEVTKGQCDTPGFPLTDHPEIKIDHRRTQRLYMPRNHQRINQTSRYLLQSWRANCDVQLLVYNSSPSNPDLSEIARVTDYVVGYQCKGNHSWTEEREQMKKLVLAAEDVGMGKRDIQRVAKQVMNKTATKRMISKQEAMVLLADYHWQIVQKLWNVYRSIILHDLRKEGKTQQTNVSSPGTAIAQQNVNTCHCMLIFSS